MNFNELMDFFFMFWVLSAVASVFVLVINRRLVPSLGLVLSVFALPLLVGLIPTEMIPVTKVIAENSNVAGSMVVKVMEPVAVPIMIESKLSIHWWSVFGTLLLIAGLVHFLMQLVQVHRLVSTGHLLRRMGKVSIYMHDEVSNSYAVWWLGRNYIVVPTNLAMDEDLFRIIRWHESMHIRLQDTLSSYVFGLFKSLNFFNPLVHMWMKRVYTELEYRCDENVLSRYRISANQYARGLLQAYESGGNHNVYSLGMTLGGSSHQLTGRITSMLSSSNKRSKLTGILGSIACVTAVAATACAFSSVSMKSKITRSELQRSAKNVKGDFPIATNNMVLKQINEFARTKKGLHHSKRSLQNFKKYQPMVMSMINKYHHPRALRAVGFVESGYRNLTQDKNPVKAAGLWQFIPGTARKFGMVVNAQRDDRLIPEVETEAAMRYLGINKLRFNDWNLSLLSYYLGERKVANAIKKSGTSDAWRLLSEGHLKDHGYLAKVHAAAVIMANPHLL